VTNKPEELQAGMQVAAVVVGIVEPEGYTVGMPVGKKNPIPLLADQNKSSDVEVAVVVAAAVEAGRAERLRIEDVAA
jgi:hypothetical protein